MNCRHIKQLQKQPSTFISSGIPGPGQGVPQQGILQTQRLGQAGTGWRQIGTQLLGKEKDRNG